MSTEPLNDLLDLLNDKQLREIIFDHWRNKWSISRGSIKGWINKNTNHSIDAIDFQELQSFAEQEFAEQ